MGFLEALNLYPKAPDSRPRREIEGDILDELRFHVEMRARENVAAGMSEDEARADAERRFGDFDETFRRCRKVQMGEKIMLQRLMAGALVVLLVAVVYLGFQIQRVSVQLSAFMEPLGAREASAAILATPEMLEDVTGSVVDEDLNPIPEAHVLLVVKTWPKDRFQQHDYAARTDHQGKFRFEKVLPKESKSALNLSVLASGYAFRSEYFDNAIYAKRYKKNTFVMKRAVPLALLFEDASGRRVVGVQVVPSERKAEGEGTHLVYLQGSEPAWRKSDPEGRTTLACFAPGDRGKLYVRFPEREWIEAEIEIPKGSQSPGITIRQPLGR